VIEAHFRVAPTVAGGGASAVCENERIVMELGPSRGAMKQSPYGVTQGIRSKRCSKKRATRVISDGKFICRLVGDKNRAYLGTYGFQSCYNVPGIFIVQGGFCNDDVNRPEMFLAVAHSFICAIGFQNAVAGSAQYQSQRDEISWLGFD
jgi:hypothetical protein